ncbi:MAG: hypothetical protein AB7P33_12380 [Dehalococcoidia bacterium]
MQAKAIDCRFVTAGSAASCPAGLGSTTTLYAETALHELAARVWPRDDATHHHELGYRYWTGLVSAYFSGLADGFLPQLSAEHDLVIVENWCYKFAAKMSLKDQTSKALHYCLPLDNRLDAVFFIDTPPELAWQRGRGFSFVELGGQDGYTTLGRDSFIDYQGRVRERLLEFADERWYRIENDGDLDSACERIEAALRPLLSAGTAR